MLDPVLFPQITGLLAIILAVCWKCSSWPTWTSMDSPVLLAWLTCQMWCLKFLSLGNKHHTCLRFTLPESLQRISEQCLFPSKPDSGSWAKHCRKPASRPRNKQQIPAQVPTLSQMPRIAWQWISPSHFFLLRTHRCGFHSSFRFPLQLPSAPNPSPTKWWDIHSTTWRGHSEHKFLLSVLQACWWSSSSEWGQCSSTTS